MILLFLCALSRKINCDALIMKFQQYNVKSIIQAPSSDDNETPLHALENSKCFNLVVMHVILFLLLQGVKK